MECKQFFKAKVSDMYYKKLHIDYYYFYQQYKDYFETAGATGANRTSFAISFLCESINVQWTYYNCRHQGEELIPIT